MRPTVAKALFQVLRAYSRGNSDRILKTWPLSSGKLRGFHQWADAKPAIGAVLVKMTTDTNLWLLLIDWRESGEFYVVLFPESRTGPIAEIHRVVDGQDGNSLHWKYRPTLHDKKNVLRKNYFEQAFGSLDIYIHIPQGIDEIDDFLDDLFSLSDCRLRADRLDDERPIQNTGFPEGKVLERRHLARERKPALVQKAKELALSKNGRLQCACCGFDFRATYGEIGSGFIEAHHTKPVSSLAASGELTRVEDLALVCSNCHRMLHRRRPWLQLSQLAKLLSDG